MLIRQASCLVERRLGYDTARLAAEMSLHESFRQQVLQYHNRVALKVCQQFLVGSALPDTKQLPQKVLMSALGIDFPPFRIDQIG